MELVLSLPEPCCYTCKHKSVAKFHGKQSGYQFKTYSDRSTTHVFNQIAMPTAAPPDAAAWRPWPDLPLDLLRDISGRFHTTTNYVRFHAVCRPWLDTLPPPERRPAFLPWLVAPRDATGHRKALCVFSSSKSSAAAAEIRVPDRRWVTSAEDGTAICWLDNTTCLVQSNDPLNGSASSTPVPRLPCEEIDSWEERAVGVSSGDGTVVLYAFGTYRCKHGFVVAIRRPGDAEWALLERNIYVNERNWQRCSVTYRNGKIILCNREKWRIVSTTKWPTAADDDDGVWRCMPNDHGIVCVSSHLVESPKELLWASVEVVRDYNDPSAGIVYNPLSTLSVSVYAFQDAGRRKPRWVKRDRRSLADTVLFLGRPSSLAMDAARFGMSGRGCAFFVDRRQIVSNGTSSSSNIVRSRVFKYSFRDRKLEFVALLPEDWMDKGCMWITPQPSIAPTEEIGERLHATHA